MKAMTAKAVTPMKAVKAMKSALQKAMKTKAAAPAMTSMKAAVQAPWPTEKRLPMKGDTWWSTMKIIFMKIKRMEKEISKQKEKEDAAFVASLPG